MRRRYVKRRDWLGRTVFDERLVSDGGCGCLLLGALILGILGMVLDFITKNWFILALAIIGLMILTIREEYEKMENEGQEMPEDDQNIEVIANDKEAFFNDSKIDPNPKQKKISELNDILQNYINQNEQKNLAKEDYQEADMNLWRRNRIEVGSRLQVTGRIREVYEDSEETVFIMCVDDIYEQKLYGSLPSRVFQKNILLEDDWVTVYGISRGRTTSDMPYADYFPMPAMEVIDYEYHEKAPE
ncbi:hypothetical protein [Streptococcus moroccensis]|uniref:Type III secretory pathway component EscV n=1 Tax=Streptococcus moroccensis TaxID=1451356 RepID=A0ABT9YNU6_9STRE|nr:hypothetical protein [Streptococcus moroccensis]MDQ0221656.1 type III secretory pathway component EscV [Streptococcus moroccensis]